MSLTTADASQSLQEIPGLDIGSIITSELLNQVREIIDKNLILLGGSALMAAGLSTLLQTLVITAVNTLGFTSAGVLQGKYLPIYTSWLNLLLYFIRLYRSPHPVSDIWRPDWWMVFSPPRNWSHCYNITTCYYNWWYIGRCWR